MKYLRSILPTLVLSVLCAASSQSQEPDIIRGRVTTPDSIPLQGVRVTVGSLITEETMVATTDRNGRYTVVFPDGGGDYIITFQQIGRRPTGRQLRRIADEAVLVADAVLEEGVVTLSSVVTLADRPVPPRRDGFPPDPTGSELTGLGNGVPPDQVGDLAAMVALLPGVTLIPNEGGAAGFSVLGLGSDENSVTLNGIVYNSNDMPLDALGNARLTTVTFDPSRGGFSGANLDMQARGGTRNISRTLRLTVDEPRLQWVDRTGSQLGREFTNLQLSGRMSGPFASNRMFYSASFQGGERRSDLRALHNTDAFALRELGISHDSVLRARSLMTSAGLPFAGSTTPSALQSRNASVVLRGDARLPGNHNLSTTLTTSYRNTQGSRLSALAAPGRGGEDESLNASMQLSHSFYFGSGMLNDARASVSMSRSSSEPYLLLPDARVRVLSDLGGDVPGVATLQLGGNSAMPSNSRNLSMQLNEQISWITYDNRHRLRLTMDVRYNEFEQLQGSNRRGTFSYNSLGDFEANTPYEFTRQLTTVERRGNLLSGALALGDAFRINPRFQLQYGVRAEANRYGHRPTFNPEVERVFGVRNDAVPNRIHISPRIGFTHSYGTAQQVAGFEGAVRGPRATIRGGIGEFRNAPSVSLIQPAMTLTGLPSGIQMLSCRGAAVPTPDWVAYAADPDAIPGECADGSGGTVFADRLPSVSLFSPSFSPQRSWRGNLAWSGALLGRFYTTFEGTYSLNLQQQSTVDLNFRNEPQFQLDGEGGRPIFVAPTSISEGSGSIASRDARVSPDFSSVSMRLSDLQSRTAQLRVTVTPYAPNWRVRWNLFYTFTDVQEYRRGFGGTTDGDPLERFWSRGSTPTHQFVPSLTLTLGGLYFGISSQISSGVRYTPMVARDINGDGDGNDRAFIFAPEAMSTPEGAEAMQRLLADAPSSARRCLERQMGAIAARNSCEGPWTSSVNVSLAIDPLRYRLPRRTNLSINFSNPLGGLDLLVNGEEGQEGWGQAQARPDATLLYVRGFDPQTNQFRYEVNPRFGSARASRATSRAPFVVTLVASLDWGPAPAKQTLGRAIDGWNSGSSRRPTEAQLRTQYVNQYGSPYRNLLRQREALSLTPEQVDTIGKLSATMATELDALWAPVIEYLVATDDDISVNRAWQRIRDAQRRSYDLQAMYGPQIRNVLEGEQLRLLPTSISNYLDKRAIIEIQRAQGLR